MSSSDSGTGVDFELYRYTPSLAAAILFLVLFIFITAYHLYQVIRMRSWYMVVFVTGGICKSNREPDGQMANGLMSAVQFRLSDISVEPWLIAIRSQFPSIQSKRS